MGLFDELDETIDDYQHRQGQKDGARGNLPGTSGDAFSQKYMEGFEAGQFDHEKDKYGETLARIAKAERDWVNSTSSSSGTGGGGGGSSSLGLYLIMILFLLGVLGYVLDCLTDDLINRVYPAYETSSEKMIRQEQEREQWKQFVSNSDQWLETPESPLPLTGKIIFISSENGNGEIFSVNPNTGEKPVNLTKRFAGNIVAMALSSDSGKIAFIANRKGESGIYVMNSDGTKIILITKAVDGLNYTELVWIRPLIILATRQNHPYVKTIWGVEIDRSGRNITLPAMILPSYKEYNDKWVPESKEQHFTFYSCESPSVSPDEKKLAFVRNEYPGSLSWTFQKRSQICLKGLESAFGPEYDKETYLRDFKSVRVRLGPQAWSPDGNKIVFQVSFEGKDRIGIWNLRNRFSLSEPEWLKAPGRNPAWSPDGNWIVFDNEGTTCAVEVASGNIRKIVGPRFFGKSSTNPLWAQ